MAGNWNHFYNGSNTFLRKLILWLSWISCQKKRGYRGISRGLVIIATTEGNGFTTTCTFPNTRSRAMIFPYILSAPTLINMISINYSKIIKYILLILIVQEIGKWYWFFIQNEESATQTLSDVSTWHGKVTNVKNIS